MVLSFPFYFFTDLNFQKIILSFFFLLFSQGGESKTKLTLLQTKCKLPFHSSMAWLIKTNGLRFNKTFQRCYIDTDFRYCSRWYELQHCRDWILASLFLKKGKFCFKLLIFLCSLCTILATYFQNRLYFIICTYLLINQIS